MSRRLLTLVLIANFIVAVHIQAQVIFPDSPKEWLVHVSYLDSIATDKINRHIFYQAAPSTSGRFVWVDPEVRFHYNSRSPFSVNDGASWRGKGITTEVNLGGQYSNKFFRATIAPLLAYSQNASFVNSPILSGTKSEWNYQFNVIGDIDYVTRYGTAPVTLFNWGQSEASLFYKNLSIGVSSQNIQFGPARNAPMLWSQQAAGVNHVQIGLDQYQSMRIKGVDLGKFKANLYYGILKESEFFDDLEENDRSYFNALSVHFLLPYIKTIKVGVNRVFHADLQYFKPADLTRTIAYFGDQETVINSSGDTINDFFDQMGSFFVEWSLKESGFRWYFEFAKNDFFGNFRDLLNDPEHARGYTIGFDKVFSLKADNRIVLGYETTNLSRTKSLLYRPNPSFYTHYEDLQGYTTNGQVLGAWIGPGSSLHTVSFAYVQNKDYLRLDVDRVQVNDDYFIENFGSGWPGNVLQGFQNRRYSTVNFALNGYKEMDKFGVFVRVGGNIHLNKYYIEDNDEFNLFSTVTLLYKMNQK